MSAQLSSVFGAGTQLFNNQGIILSGGKITTYQAGTTTLYTTWTTSDQTVANSNPIILDSAGRIPNEIWLAAGIAYKFVVTDSNNNPIGTWDNIPGVTSSATINSEWVTGLTPTYISGTSFSVVGNQTATYSEYRRIQFVVGSGVFYGMIINSSYDGSTKTTVNIIPDTTSMDSSLSAVSYGIVGTVPQGSTGPSSLLASAVSIPGVEFMRHRNRTINGTMLVNQRRLVGLNMPVGNVTYFIDRFYCTPSGAPVTVTQTSDQVSYSSTLRWSILAQGAASVTGIIIGHRYESVMVQDLAFSQVSFSVDLANNLFSTVTWTAYYASAGVDNFSSKVQFATGTFTGVPNTLASISRFYASFNMNGATIPTSNGIAIELSVGAQTSGSWWIANWQLEAGYGFTPIEQRPYELELSMCQRYYYRTAAPLNSGTLAPYAWATSSTTANGVTYFPVQMRTAPTALEQTGTASDYRTNIGGTITTCSSVPNFSSATVNSAKCVFTVASGLTTGQAGEIIAAASVANGYLGFSAEI